MNSVVEVLDAEASEFFAPARTDLVDSLIGQYQSMRNRIDELAEMVTGEIAGAISYFIEGNKDTHSRYAPAVSTVFRKEGAVAALNAAYWSKALAMTDVLDCMPQARRDEWNKSITEMKAPDFEEATVRATIQGLLASRTKFFSERVDGIFRGLSGEHVTNSPMGFSKRMILGYVLNEYSSVGQTQAGRINDLRAVIAKFMGRDEPKHYASYRLIDTLKGHWGEWMTIDGGALRIRLYKKGTAHLEVHPDMAWRLNSVLANLYPMAIPSELRQKPKKKTKDFVMMGRPLPFAVIEIIGELRRERGTNRFSFGYAGADNKPAVAEANQVLRSIGGVIDGRGVEFDYDPRTVLDEIITSGCIPDQRAHQFYPTPENVAMAAIELAQIGPEHTCLEPSAGQGGLADYMPKDRTRCVEISPLHCKILKAKGFVVDQADFLACDYRLPFDRIVMNPPYSEGRWQAHIEAAAGLLTPKGRLVAVLPASARGKNVLPGFVCEWSQVFSNEFAGTSVSVAIVAAVRK
jgi:hypothetical protein